MHTACICFHYAHPQGQWSIGIFRGPSPWQLSPVESWSPAANTPSAWPAANPVISCATRSSHPASFVADPFLVHTPRSGAPDTLHVFFESKTLANMQGDIGCAVSVDGGRSFKHLGIVLDEPWHLSYPFVFQYAGSYYMMPEGAKGGALRLYRADPFPTRWVEETVMIDQPLVDSSLVPPDVAESAGLGGGGRWFLFTSNQRAKASKRCRQLEIWSAPALHGPWSLHPASPVRAWVQGSRMAGRPIVVGGKLYRFGQDCGATYGGSMRVFLVTKLDESQYEEVEVPEGLGFDPASGRVGESGWNAARHHHMDAQQLPTGAPPPCDFLSRGRRECLRLEACVVPEREQAAGALRVPWLERFDVPSGII